MFSTRDAAEVLDHDFLETRCKILEIAATLDRIDRAPARHGEHPDARLGQLRQALEALVEPGPGRAETIQRIFSLEYDPGWRETMNVVRSRTTPVEPGGAGPFRRVPFDSSQRQIGIFWEGAMPTVLVSPERIPELATQIDSLAMLRLLRRLRETGFIQNTSELDKETVALLQRLSTLGLVDAGFDGPTDGKPFIWVNNGNGEGVLKYLETSPHSEETLESKIKIHPRAHTALASLPDKTRMAVLTAAESLQGADPASWPPEKVNRLNPDKPIYLLRVSRNSGHSSGFSIRESSSCSTSLVRKRRLFLERSRTGSRVG